MSNSNTQRPPAIRSDLLERFKKDVESRRGRLRGNYATELERAIESYLDASKGGDVTHRLDQIESDLEEIKALLSESEEKKKKETSRDSTTENRLRKIKHTIADETGGSQKVHATVVEMAIREHAGASDPTIRRYKRLLQQDRELFEHPIKENLYFADAEIFTQAVNAMAKASKLPGDTYESVVEEYGREWWSDQLDEHTERGIQ